MAKLGAHITQIEIRWAPARPALAAAVKDAIVDAVDNLFIKLTEDGQLAAADSTVRFLRDEGA